MYTDRQTLWNPMYTDRQTLWNPMYTDRQTLWRTDMLNVSCWTNECIIVDERIYQGWRCIQTDRHCKIQCIQTDIVKDIVKSKLYRQTLWKTLWNPDYTVIVKDRHAKCFMLDEWIHHCRRTNISRLTMYTDRQTDWDTGGMFKAFI